ncbi:hypothetical protein Ancab_029462 [Ancistrocladus abbreviatus]
MVEFAQRSARVKSLDMHPTEPWVLMSLHSGVVSIWNYESKAMMNSLEVTGVPVRTAKFIARKQWIVTGADDMFIRVYDYNTLEKIKEFEAHIDYIRCVVVHPTLPYILSVSDDKHIKLWNWETDWGCAQTFEGHSHYVMQVAFDPRDSSSFASASLDGSTKIWNLDSRQPIATVEAHPRGVNCVSYFVNMDKSLLLTGSDDYTAKVWDYPSNSCLRTLEGHTNNVTAISVHPELPIIVSGSEDQTVRVWNVITYGLEKTLNHDLGRVWAIEFVKGTSQVVIGCDEGFILGNIIGS